MTWLISATIGAIIGANVSGVIEQHMGRDAAVMAAILGCCVAFWFWARRAEG